MPTSSSAHKAVSVAQATAGAERCPCLVQTVIDLRKESKACRKAGREQRRALREGESLRVAAPEPFTPDSASSMEQVCAALYTVDTLSPHLRIRTPHA